MLVTEFIVYYCYMFVFHYYTIRTLVSFVPFVRCRIQYLAFGKNSVGRIKPRCYKIVRLQIGWMGGGWMDGWMGEWIRI